MLLIEIAVFKNKRFPFVKKGGRRISLILLVLTISTVSAVSQTYIGPSLNLGNLLKYTPVSPGLGTPPMPSGSIVVNVRKNLQNDWAIVFGASAGIIGYSMVVTPEDTLSANSYDNKNRFSEYSTFYGGLNVVIGKDITIGIRKLLVGIGGGGVYSYSISPASYGVAAAGSDGSFATTFYAKINPVNKFNAFAKIVAQLPVSPRVSLAFEVSRHFSSVIDGTYDFYHTNWDTTSGKISLYQTEASMACLFRISR
ncbi:hypothetical protein WBG78_07740 [Chryseolinea sp. T2]|uniref:hypothetical protein n=1 Tax=Chryseolinea sp. T2 TaxID=3129255 RepID=UPI003076AACA